MKHERIDHNESVNLHYMMMVMIMMVVMIVGWWDGDRHGDLDG